jgi:hydrogenase maturation factor
MSLRAISNRSEALAPPGAPEYSAVDPAAAGGALARLQAAGIPAAAIGEVLPGPAGCTWDDGTPLPAAGRDELARYLESL